MLQIITTKTSLRKFKREKNFSECQQIIAGGDFDSIFDISKDKSGGNETTHKSLMELPIW